jgi:hypothetical protein
MVGACLLARLYNLTAEEALERVNLAFQLRGDNKYRSPQTDEQRAFVRRYIDSLL